MIELCDAVSMFENKMQTLTEEIMRTGRLKDVNILLEFTDGFNKNAVVTCDVDGMKTILFLTQEERLPFSITRESIKNDGLEFLFQDCSEKQSGKWKYSADLNDDEKSVKYLLKNEFHSPYTETPLRDGLSSSGLEIKLLLYFPSQGKNGHYDGIAVLEVGNNLTQNSGLVHYYNFRVILESDAKYI